MLAEIFGIDGIVVIVVLAVVLFGGSQIPKIARSLGSARKEFAQGSRDGAGNSPPAVEELTVVVSGPPTSATLGQEARPLDPSL